MKHKLSTITLAILSATSLNFAASVHAKEAEQEVEVIEVTGIRSALASALNEKRSASGIKEIIQAEDIGKLPDSNLAEVMENITGVQITRENGVGTGVQIRGTGQNRVEINGVSSVGAGSSRTGISFEDLPAALISSLEVTKSPSAKTIEGSVGGTINLRTLRGNSLDERLLQFRLQGEQSDLADSTTPRFSATFGDNWETKHGKVGLVLTGSYAEQDVASIKPRIDRDRIVKPDATGADGEIARDSTFMRLQFLDAPFDSRQYTTTNFTGSLEWQQSDNLKFYADATINDQEMLRSEIRFMGSGVGSGWTVAESTVTSVETRDLGTIDGPNGIYDLGSIDVATGGLIIPAIREGGRHLDPNLRLGGNNTPRLTKSNVFSFGGEWVGDKLTVKAEASYSDAEDRAPKLSNTLDFINPNSTQPNGDPGSTGYYDNGTPFIYNAHGSFYEWGIAQGLDTTPTTAMLLDPKNWGLNELRISNDTSDGEETSLRTDFSYDISDDTSFFTDIHAGVRYNESKSSRANASSRTRTRFWDRPRGDTFSEILVQGPDNFGSIDGRELYIKDYLMISPELSANNPQYVRDIIDAAITQNNAETGRTTGLTATPEVAASSQFAITEETTALYLQGDFELELGEVFVSGDLGVRHISTDVTSIGNSITEDTSGNTIISKTNTTSDYSFTLPRLNVAIELTDDLVVRLGAGKDIRRPNFDDLSTSVSWGETPYDEVSAGNPDLKPEEITSYDLSFEYYFAESSLVSVGFFQKDRSELISGFDSFPTRTINPTSGELERNVDGDCSGGGIWNPYVPSDAYGAESSRTDTTGICVTHETTSNIAGTEDVKGIELAFQGDLSSFEEQLGWASGFGLIANYTYQKAGGSLDSFRYANNTINTGLNRTDGMEMDDNGNRIYETATTADDVIAIRNTLSNLSNNAYNVTAYYDKYDISVRVRYTWRDSYRDANFGNTIGGMIPHFSDRGQLNMAIGYDINDMVNVGIQAVNLTREDKTVWCVNENAVFCENDKADRRITAGITVKL